MPKDPIITSTAEKYFDTLFWKYVLEGQFGLNKIWDNCKGLFNSNVPDRQAIVALSFLQLIKNHTFCTEIRCEASLQ